jgi:hypothetical protein
LFEIDESRALPQVILELVAGDELPGPVKEKQKDLKRLALKAYEVSGLAQVAREVIVFERTEDHPSRSVRMVFHRIETVSQHACGQ